MAYALDDGSANTKSLIERIEAFTPLFAVLNERTVQDKPFLTGAGTSAWVKLVAMMPDDWQRSHSDLLNALDMSLPTITEPQFNVGNIKEVQVPEERVETDATMEDPSAELPDVRMQG